MEANYVASYWIRQSEIDSVQLTPDSPHNCNL